MFIEGHVIRYLMVLIAFLRLQTVMLYFDGLPRLSEALSKQLSLILQRTLISVRMEPTIIVTVLRIIEREEGFVIVVVPLVTN